MFLEKDREQFDRAFGDVMLSFRELAGAGVAFVVLAEISKTWHLFPGFSLSTFVCL